MFLVMNKYGSAVLERFMLLMDPPDCRNNCKHKADQMGGADVVSSDDSMMSRSIFHDLIRSSLACF